MEPAFEAAGGVRNQTSALQLLPLYAHAFTSILGKLDSADSEASSRDQDVGAKSRGPSEIQGR